MPIIEIKHIKKEYIMGDQLIAAANFETRCVAAIANGVRAGRRNAAADAPEMDGKIFGYAHESVDPSQSRGRWGAPPLSSVSLA